METGSFLRGVAIPFSSPFFLVSNFAEFSQKFQCDTYMYQQTFPVHIHKTVA